MLPSYYYLTSFIISDKSDTKRTPDRTKTIQKFNKKPENKSFQKFNGKPDNKFKGKPENKSFQKFHGKPGNKSFQKSDGKPENKSFQKFNSKPERTNQRPPKEEEEKDENDVKIVNYVLNPRSLQKKKMDVKELVQNERNQAFQQKSKFPINYYQLAAY